MNQDNSILSNFSNLRTCFVKILLTNEVNLDDLNPLEQE